MWFSLLTLITAGGPGALSLDHLIWNSRLPVPAIAFKPEAFLKQQRRPPWPGGLFVSQTDARLLSDRERNGNFVLDRPAAW
jgi:hypothetical protein